MSLPKLCVSWDSFNYNISNGFSHLRQHEEFVDMTLAAEGHLIKVHRNLMALASPYLKEMLQSAACHHPVIFLNNVNHEILSYIVEYIYNGEVHVPSDMLSGFLEASMALHIRGVENVVPPNNNHINKKDELPERINHFAAHITINSENFNLEVQQFNNNTDHDYSVLNNEKMRTDPGNFPTIEINPGGIVELQNIPDIDNFEEIPQNFMDISGNSDKTPQLPNPAQNTDSIQKVQPQQLNNEDKEEEIKTATGLIGLLPQYTISNRGSLQLILNRHLYYFHHQSCGGRKRRWRCVDYRRMHCPAFIDTDGEVIMRREGIHSHAYHDSKIDKKRRKGSVYKSLASVEIGVKHDNVTQLSGDEDEIFVPITASKSLDIIN